MFHLRYIYTSAISMDEVIRNDVPAILLAADELELTVLLEYMQKELIDNFQDWLKRHVVKIIHATSRLASCKQLYDYCLERVTETPELVFESSEFALLEHAVLKSLLERE